MVSTLVAAGLALSAALDSPAPRLRAGEPAAPAPQASASLDDHGVFILSVGGRKIGTERFEIKSSGGTVEAKAEIVLRLEQDGKTIEVRTSPDLRLNSRLEPQTYAWSQTGAQSSSLNVDFRKSPAKCRYRTVTGQEDDREFDLPADVVVLDENVLHHYALVASRMNPSAQGPQTFKAFVPQEAAPGVLTIQELAGGGEKLRHLQVTTELSQIDLWVDEEGRLKRVANAETQFEAVRKK